MSAIFIPQKIRVGFQNREGTYTGKLAYVIYYDKLGKIRKEASFNSWRDHSIEPLECTNEPTTGFVLNKKAGDYSSSWGGRKAYSRVYDPRGFEFEINVDNLLFILENCSSSPGKALDGEFVYAYEGKDLVLMPTNCVDYKEHASFSALKERKISPKKIKVGHEYLDKSNDKYVCLGQCRWYEHSPTYKSNETTFYNIKDKTFNRSKHNFIWESDGPVEIDGLITEFSSSIHGSPAVELFEAPHEYDSRYRYYKKEKIEKIDDCFRIQFYDMQLFESDYRYDIKIEDGEIKKYSKNLVVWEKERGGYYGYSYNNRILSDERTRITKEEWDSLNTKLFARLQSGEIIKCL